VGRESAPNAVCTLANISEDTASVLAIANLRDEIYNSVDDAISGF